MATTTATATARAPDDRTWSGAEIYTIGHSTRPLDELIALCRQYRITTLADVRTIPRSRHNPQFNLDELARTLPEAGIAYAHLASLGGLRHGRGKDSPNTAWRNQSFRGYADYMQTSEFADGLAELRMLSESGPVAVMCAEAVPWRCHRSLIADALLVRGVKTADIQGLDRTMPHKLTPFAHVDGLRITYPPEPESTSAPEEGDSGHEK